MNPAVALISFGLAALAFSALAGLLVIGWKGRLAAALLLAAALASAGWALASAAAVAWDARLLPVAGLLEVLRSASWFALLLALLALGRKAVGRHGFGWWNGVLVVGPLLAGLALEAAAFLGWLERSATPYLAFRVLLATVGLMLVEQLYRNTPVESRWGIKFLCLGLGGIFAFDLYVYAEAMLFRRIDLDVWVARGAVNALAAPLLAVSASRNRHWSAEVSVSRQVVFHSAALLGVGIYLSVMGGVGYYVRIVGGAWGGVLQVAFLAGVVTVLLVLLFSGTVRSRLRVYLSKHFFSYRFDYRQEWLRFTRTLAAGEPGVRLNERAISAIAQMVESPGGVLWLRDEHGDYERVADVNYPQLTGSEAKSGALARFLAERQWVVSLDEYAESPDVYGDLELPAWMQNAKDVWLVVPLILHEELLGFVVLARPRVHQALNWELTDLLKVAGRQAAGYLGHLRAAQQLIVARQFESFNKMSAFVIHDLKNIVAQLALMLANAEKHKHKPAFQDDMLKTVENAVDKMNKLLGHLRSGTTPIDKPVAVDLGELVARAVADKAQMHPRPEIQVGAPGLRALAHGDRLQRVVGHLVQNAIEATPTDGRVWVRVAQEGPSAVIEVGDTGQGMSAEFVRERLFRPFESTKKNGMGIGTYESRHYVREIGGSLEVESQPQKGTRFRIVLPIPKAVSPALEHAA
jgi:putative PEP-CTERM system histidine kinase